MSTIKVSSAVSLRTLGSGHVRRASHVRRALLLALVAYATSVFLYFSPGVSAVNRTWDGGGDDNNWSTAANWSGDTVPSAQDVAIFDGTSTKNATINVNINVAGIQINAGYTNTGPGTGTITQATGVTVTTGTYSQSDGEFAGSDSALDINGEFTLSGGTFTASSNTTFFGSSFTHNAGGTFTNNGGTVVFDGSGGTITVNPPETFHNLTYSRTAFSFLDGRLIVTGTIVLNDGSPSRAAGGGVIEAQAGVTINNSFDGGSAELLIMPGSPATTAPTQTAFNSLSLLHNEGGTLVDRTISRTFATRTICADVNSLSPFVLAEQVDAAMPSINGLVVDAAGNPLSNVLVNLSGTETRATTTDSDGVFNFANLTAGGNYNVQPKHVGFLFTQPNQDFLALNNEQTVVFVATAASFSVSGKVTDANGSGIAGVEVTLEGAATEITDGNGDYAFSNVPAGGDYFVTPFKADLTFAPGQTLIQNLSSDQTEVNFTVSAVVPLPAPQIVAGPALLINESCPPSNTALDPGERVTINLSLTNSGDGASNNLVATLQATGGVTAPSGPQSYGVIAPGTTVARDFSLTVDPNLVCGGALTATLQLQDGTTNLGLVTYNLRLGVDNGGSFVCTAQCGGVRLVVTSTLTRTTPSTVQAAITVQNIGSTAANNVVLTTGKLGSNTGTPLPQALGDIPPGGSMSGVLHFDNSSSGGSVLSVSGTYTGGAFNSSRRVTLQ